MNISYPLIRTRTYQKLSKKDNIVLPLPNVPLAIIEEPINIPESLT